jgi:3-hydroxyacyl-[acyl-carrier-protein] dehydratase
VSSLKALPQAIPLQPLEHRELRRYLPHRFPFMLVDRVTDYEPHQWIRGIKNLASWEPLLVPKPAAFLPTGLIIEAIGQLAIALTNLSKQVDQLSDIVLGSISDVEVESRVPLGCCLELHAEVIKELDNGFVYRGGASVDGNPVLLMGTLKCALSQ